MKKTKKLLLTILMIGMTITFGIRNSFSQVTDKDGNKYKTVKIGNQGWTAENLNVTHYRNGDVIPQVQDTNVWKNLTTGAWCYYKNKESNGKIYGKLYNWYAVNDPRGLAPEGWHIPSDEEWTQLTDYLGGNDVAGDKLKDKNFWEIPNDGETNSIGFNALPGGFCSDYGKFYFIDGFAQFWTSSELNGKALYRGLNYFGSDVYLLDFSKKLGLSVRCVKD